MAIFVIFKMAAAAIKNSKFLQLVHCKGPVCITMRNFIKISQAVAIYRFPKWRPSATMDL